MREGRQTVQNGKKGYLWDIFKYPLVVLETRNLKLAKGRSTAGQIPLPIQGEELLGSLISVMEYETGIADIAVNDALEFLILKEFTDWFGVRPRELDQGMLKKIRNSTSAPGNQGDRRTLDALVSMDIWSKDKKKITVDEAAHSLRLATQELRRAKTYLFHQAKCVRSVTSFILEDLAINKKKSIFVPVEDFEEFTKWGKDIWTYWRDLSPMDLKNRLMVSNFWLNFVDSFKLENEDLISHYNSTIQNKLKDFVSPSNYGSLFEQELAKVNSAVRFEQSPTPQNFDLASNDIKLETKIAGRQVLLIFGLSNWSSAKIAEAQFGLAYELSEDADFSKLDISVSSDSNQFNEIRVSLTKPNGPDILAKLAEKSLKYLGS